MSNVVEERIENEEKEDQTVIMSEKYQGDPIPVPGMLDDTPLFNDPMEIVRDPLDLTMKAIEKYGKIVYLKSTNSYIVVDADFLEEMLIHNEKYFSKSQETMDKISPAIGNGLSTLIGHEWKRQRKLANPSFSKKSVSQFFEIFHECLDEMFDEWDKNDTSIINITTEMKRLTLRIVIKCLFSTDIIKFSNDVTSALEILQEHSINNLWAPHLITESQTKAYEEAKASIDAVIYEIIAHRRENGNEGKNDLLAMYMSAIYEDTNEGMSDTQLRHEIMNLFLAGHETTANGVAFALYLLAKNPEVEKQFSQEVDNLLSGKKHPSMEELKSLDLTARIFKESLRLYPSSWAMSRVVTHNYRYKNYVFPKGADFIVAQWGLHRISDYWDEPFRFDPDRFLPERFKDIHKFAYMPFGAGARKCIGVHLAEAEGQTILARIGQRYHLQATEKTAPNTKAKLFMTSVPGIELQVTKKTKRA